MGTVSYTHLDVYKRQAQTGVKKIFGDRAFGERLAKNCLLYTSSDCTAVRVSARDAYGNCEYSREYRVLEYNKDPEEDTERARMICRGFLQTDDNTGEEQMLSRGALAKILLAFGSNHEGMELSLIHILPLMPALTDIM